MVNISQNPGILLSSIKCLIRLVSVNPRRAYQLLTSFGYHVYRYHLPVSRTSEYVEKQTALHPSPIVRTVRVSILHNYDGEIVQFRIFVAVIKMSS